jgi:hypothetical protein
MHSGSFTRQGTANMLWALSRLNPELRRNELTAALEKRALVPPSPLFPGTNRKHYLVKIGRISLPRPVQIGRAALRARFSRRAVGPWAAASGGAQQPGAPCRIGRAR